MDTAAPISAVPHPAMPQSSGSQSAAPEPTSETPAPLRRCRSIAPHGRQCPDPALRSEIFCYTHRRDRIRESALRTAPAVIEVPRLDSHAAIQSVATEVARALAAGTIDPAAARGIQSMLAIAIRTLPRPGTRAASPASAKSEAAGNSGSSFTGSRPSTDRTGKSSAGQPHSTYTPELNHSNASPITEIVIGPQGAELAPDIPYHAPEAKPERVWSFAEYLYRTAHPERANDPLPEEGYIDPEKGSSIPDPNAVSEDTATKNAASETLNGKTADRPIAGILPELKAVAIRRSCHVRSPAGAVSWPQDIRTRTKSRSFTSRGLITKGMAT